MKAHFQPPPPPCSLATATRPLLATDRPPGGGWGGYPTINAAALSMLSCMSWGRNFEIFSVWAVLQPISQSIL